MSETVYTPLYQYEYELISVRIGKPSQNLGAFIEVDGNIQFGFMDEQYTGGLIPLLESIIKKHTDGIYKFYKCKHSSYRFHSRALMVVFSNETGVVLQQHAKKTLNTHNIFKTISSLQIK